jgi:hypothetical protein
MLEPDDRGRTLADLLPAHLLARRHDLAGDEPTVPVAAVCCRRYAVEDNEERFTLDCEVQTDTGLCLPYAVLEFKSSRAEPRFPAALDAIELRPIKLSKFLWATGPGC